MNAISWLLWKMDYWLVSRNSKRVRYQ